MINCTFEDGGHGALRHATVDGILVKDRGVILSRRAAGIPEAGRWSFPGGYVDRDETVAQALAREVREEVMVTVKSAVLFAVVSDPNRDPLERQNISLVFLVTDWDGEPRVGMEVSAVRLFERGTMPGVREMASDHHRVLERYFSWKTSPHTLPFVM